MDQTPKRPSRERRARAEEQRKTRGRNVEPFPMGLVLWPLLAVLLLVGATVGLIYLNKSRAEDEASTQPTSSVVDQATPNTNLEGLQRFTDLKRDHVGGSVSYPQSPPVGGEHNAEWIPCKVYDQPLPNERAVHSLEHGAVWITYRPDLSQAEVDVLRELASGRRYTIVSPYPGLKAAIVASAWGLQLTLDQASDPRLPSFIRTYEQGPQTPEPGTSC